MTDLAGVRDAPPNHQLTQSPNHHLPSPFPPSHFRSFPLRLRNTVRVLPPQGAYPRPALRKERDACQNPRDENLAPNQPI